MSELTAESPFVSRLLAYLDERFPPIPMLIVTALTVSCTSFVAGALLGTAPVVFDGGLILLGAAYFLTLLFLRVFDEHKDYDRDVQAYPERVLSRGLITLGHLKAIGAVCALASWAIAAALGPAVLVSYAVVFVYVCLMGKEFFLGKWLEKDVWVYAATHQPINMVMLVWLYLGYAGRGATVDDLSLQTIVPWGLLPYLLVSQCLGFGYEVSRKLFTPEEEQPGLVDSYSSHAVGPRGAAAVALLFSLGGVGCAVWLAVALKLPTWVHVPFGLGALVFLSALGKFMAKPYPKAKKNLEGAAGLGGMFVYLGLIAAICSQLGASWTLWRGAWG